MARMNSESYSISISAMMGSLTLLFLYLAAILPTAKLSMYAISSLFTVPICIEKRTGFAFMMFIAVSLLSLLILPNIAVGIPYFLFFGHYGIAKFHIENMKDKALAFAIKLAYFNILIIAAYFIAKNTLLVGIPDILKDNVWALVVAAQIAFIAYDFIYSKFAEMYNVRFRPYLIKRGRR
jgi:hypothetical protein